MVIHTLLMLFTGGDGKSIECTFRIIWTLMDEKREECDISYINSYQIFRQMMQVDTLFEAT